MKLASRTVEDIGILILPVGTKVADVITAQGTDH